MDAVTGPAFYGMGEIAEALSTPGRKVSRGTVNVWRARGQLPKPDGFASGRPVWVPKTIEPWIATKRGELQSARQ